MPPPAGASSPVRLIIFGDSWAKTETATRTWPELLGDRLGWTTVNVALPGSNSSLLQLQGEILLSYLSRRGQEVHEDAWALIHTGGNDLLAGRPEQLLGYVTSALGRMLCCGAPCCGTAPVLDHVAANVQELVAQLYAQLGVRNVLLVRPPLTAPARPEPPQSG